MLSSDALSSSAYATEQMLLVLMLAAAAPDGQLQGGAFILLLLLIVIVSYRQTVYAYPGGGGAYFVAKENLGTNFGLVAAAALLVDYVLTVTVSVAAGVDAIASAFPSLTSHRVGIGIAAILVVALGNLRGIRKSGALFSVPTYFFVLMFGAMLVVNVVHPFGYWRAPTDAVAAGLAEPVTLWLLLKAFASGCSALTGVEAVAKRRTGLSSARIQECCHRHCLDGPDSRRLLRRLDVRSVPATPYSPLAIQTVISQLGHGAFGDGPLYFALQIATMCILILAANTAFADFPRLARSSAATRTCRGSSPTGGTGWCSRTGSSCSPSWRGCSCGRSAATRAR